MTAPKAEPDIWLVGDPHGEFRRVIRLGLERRPAAVIFLGDLELPAPAEEIFYPLMKQKTIVRYIPGNHDADDFDLWERLTGGPLADTFNLHGRVEEICGLRIAGLGGIFHTKAWIPPEQPSFESYAELDRSLVPWWWNEAQRAQHGNSVRQARLTHCATIFPDVYWALAAQEAEVLVTHEAPGGEGGHKYGFQAIRDLADLMGPKTGGMRAFHGHHHQSRRYVLHSICQWTSVGMREIVDLEGRRVE